MNYSLKAPRNARGFPLFREAVSRDSKLGFLDAIWHERDLNGGAFNGVTDDVEAAFPHNWYWNDYSSEGIVDPPLGDALGTYLNGLIVGERAHGIILQAHPDLEKFILRRTIGRLLIFYIYPYKEGWMPRGSSPLFLLSNPARIACTPAFKSLWESHKLTGLVFTPVE